MVEDLEAFARRAGVHWTPELVRKVTGGKAHPIPPGEGALVLRALGLLAKDASMPADAVRKYGQIGHLVTLVEDAIGDLCRAFPTVRVLDAGCGSSYLTFLLAWCFSNRWRHPAELLGVDRDARVITKCRERALAAGLGDGLRFEALALSELDWAEAHARHFAHAEPPTRPHAVVALHACDTATCDALAKAITLEADFVAVAPCCQAELARGWSALAGEQTDGAFAPIWRAPQLRRELGASVTDAMRLLLLRGCGYEVTATEFVPSSHTPKNTLLRGVRRGRYLMDALSQYAALKAATGGIGIRLEELLPPEHRERLARAQALATP